MIVQLEDPLVLNKCIVQGPGLMVVCILLLFTPILYAKGALLQQKVHINIL